MGYPDMMRDIMAQAVREAIASRRKAIANMSIVDRLTGLYNREYFHLRLDEEMARSRQYGNKLSVILIDTGLALPGDHGRESLRAGKTMQIIAEIIGDGLTDTIGLAFLYDEGKFAIILPEADSQEAALIADNMRKRIIEEKIQGMTPHAAVVQYRDHETIDAMIPAADDALCENS